MATILPVGVNPINVNLTTLISRIATGDPARDTDVHAVVVLSTNKPAQFYVNTESSCQVLNEIVDLNVSYPPLSDVTIKRLDYFSAMPYAGAAAQSCWYVVNKRKYHCKP